MKELDLLKKNWKQREDSFAQLTELEIYQMLHKKSASIVRRILIISILEVVFWTLVGFGFNTDTYFESVNLSNWSLVLEALTYFNYGVILVFVYVLYTNYTQINTTLATKELLGAILKTRKTVQYYVYYNLAWVLVSLLIGFGIGVFYNSEVASLSYKMANNRGFLLLMLGVAIGTMAVFLGFFWLFYKILYGSLLKGLLQNYHELKKIDL
ncbi:hypothetical protein [Flavobacterium crassostreae]|uniref:hypothetical protein n=1 Tax=Flavobacterium crassostreae TaxID=1763534 RepID=UPI0008A6220F|nr:hypothetical protein [Flavobacterium crassostreae]